MSIHYEADGPVVVVTIDRPDVANAIDRPTADALADAFRRFDSDASLSVAVLTGEYGAQVLEPLLGRLGRHDVRVVPVRNDFFGGTTAVTGLLVGADLARVLADEPEGHRYLLPDVCLSDGRFLDGTTPSDLPRPVEVVATDGIALRTAILGGAS